MNLAAQLWQHKDCCPSAIYTTGGLPRRPRPAILPEDAMPGAISAPIPKRVRRCANGGGTPR